MRCKAHFAKCRQQLSLVLYADGINSTALKTNPSSLSLSLYSFFKILFLYFLLSIQTAAKVLILFFLVAAQFVSLPLYWIVFSYLISIYLCALSLLLLLR